MYPLSQLRVKLSLSKKAMALYLDIPVSQVNAAENKDGILNDKALATFNSLEKIVEQFEPELPGVLS